MVSLKRANTCEHLNQIRLSVSQIDVAYNAPRKIFILELENPIYQRLEYFSSNKLCK
jgi:hypothetical protein